MKFEGSCLKQEIRSFELRNVINLFIVHKLDRCSKDLKIDFTVGVCLFRAFRLANNTDPDKYRHSDYGNRSDASWFFSLPNGEWGKTVVKFGLGDSSSTHIDNRKKYLKS